MEERLRNLEVGISVASRRERKHRTTTEAYLQEIAGVFYFEENIDSQISTLGLWCPWKLV